MPRTPTEPDSVQLMPGERSMGTALTELGMGLAFIVGTVIVISCVTTDGTFLTKDFVWNAWWLIAIGASFLTESAWMLPTFLAIVLALYAALIGQSVTNTSMEAMLKSRRRLTPAGLGIAAFVIAFTATGILAAISFPTEWPKVPGIVVVALAVILLGVGVGRFESRSVPLQLNMARGQRRIHVAEMALLPPASESSHSAPRPDIILRSAVIGYLFLTPVPLVVVMLLGGSPFPAVLTTLGAVGVFNCLWTLVGLVAPLALVEAGYFGTRGRLAKEIIAGILVAAVAGFAIFFGGIAFVSSPTGSAIDPGIVALVLPGVAAFVLVEISLFAGRRLPARIFPWTLRFAVVEAARESRRRKIDRLDSEIAALEARLAPRRKGILGALQARRERRSVT